MGEVSFFHFSEDAVSDGELKLSELKLDKRNPRKHGERNREMVKSSLQEIGAARSVVVDENGEILAGNATVEAARELGLSLQIVEGAPDKLIAVRRRDLTAEQKRRLAYLDNRTAEIAEWDAEQIAADLEGGFDLQGIFDKQEIADILASIKSEPPEDPGAQIDRAAELQEQWHTELGQLWELGEHRLICGDCTDKAVVERVMGGERAGAVVTDPPYGMNVDVAYAKMHHGDGVYTVNRFKPVIGDDKPFDASILLTMFDYCPEIALFGGDYYVHHLPDGGGWFCWDKRWNESGMDLDKVHGSAFELIWSKQAHKREIARITWSGHHGMAHDDLKSRMHPTQKPTLIMEWLLERIKGDPIVDPFLGSGTTLIACERLGRKCRAIEISPAYIAVALQRWTDMTGKLPILIGESVKE